MPSLTKRNVIPQKKQSIIFFSKICVKCCNKKRDFAKSPRPSCFTACTMAGCNLMVSDHPDFRIYLNKI